MTSSTTLRTLLCVCFAIACGNREAPPSREVPGARPAAAFTVKEAWRTQLGRFMPAHATPTRDGGVLLAARPSKPVTVGGRTITPRGETDSVILELGADGKLGRHVQLGDEGHTDVLDLVVLDDRVLVAVEVRGKLRVGDVQLATHPPEALAIVALLELDLANTPQRPRVLYQGTDASTVDLLALSDGDYLVALSRSGERDTATVTRYAADDKPRWQRSFGHVEVKILAATPERIAIGERERSTLARPQRLAVRLLDTNGDVVGVHEIRKAPGMGDLGSIGGGVFAGETLWAFGETGGGVVVGGKSIERGTQSIQPFALAIRGNEARFTDLTPGTGQVFVAHVSADVPVVGYSVIHPPLGASLPHRGTYFARWGTPQQHTPVYQERFENDDWETRPPITVTGEMLSAPRGVAAGDAVYVWGMCEQSCTDARCFCITKQLLAPPR